MSALLLNVLLIAPSLRVQDERGGVEFGRDVRPILEEACGSCHGPDRQRARLRLDDPVALAAGGLSGPVVVAGAPQDSLLVQRLTTEDQSERMPRDAPALPAEQIEVLRRWIAAGARGLPEGGPSVWLTHWAYRAPVRVEPAEPEDSSWSRGPIDQYVLLRMESMGLRPSPEASRETLLRRWSLDLIGLPPTEEEMDDFLADVEEGADERVVDRLLASPHFGERWAVPWLDLARYADTDGFNIDGGRTIWKYRDWVIDAFNRDLPFTRFTIEQLAGDMLEDADESTRVATGFHRNTRRNTEGGVDAQEARWEQLLDRVNTTAAIWLGSTVGCAQCHNHKYDPFGQREYYELLAFFESAEEPSLDVTSPADRARRAELDARLKELRAQEPVDAAEVERLSKELKGIPRVTTLVMREKGGGGVPKTHFRERGSYVAKGELLEAGTPAALHAFSPEFSRDRLGLARWLVDERNPLVSRVTVNRYWAELFGRGLVETLEDFGTQGAAPTHRGLLDWLALTFVADGWSTKQLLRRIVLSATYRQDSRLTPALLEVDPDNRWLSRGARFRLEAERVRDAFLTASGQLIPVVGGPSVFPLQADTSGVIPINKTSTRWSPSPGGDRHRRGIYTYWRRTMLFTAFAAFDAPTREFCTPRRARTNTPLQALVGLNDPAFFDAARALAMRALTEIEGDEEERLRRAFRWCVSRFPTAPELQLLQSVLAKEVEAFSGRAEEARQIVGREHAAALGAGPAASTRSVEELAAWTMLANVLLNLDEGLCRS